jgi:hypothetical protein
MSSVEDVITLSAQQRNSTGKQLEILWWSFDSDNEARFPCHTPVRCGTSLPHAETLVQISSNIANRKGIDTDGTRHSGDREILLKSSLGDGGEHSRLLCTN